MPLSLVSKKKLIFLNNKIISTNKIIFNGILYKFNSD